MTLHNHLHFRESAVALATRGAAIRPRTYNEQNNTIEAIVATDTPVRRAAADGSEFLEVLSIEGADISALRGASVLNSHQQHGLDNVLGTVEEAWREQNTIVARIRLSTRPEVASIVEDIRAGILASVSIGYEVSKWEDSVGANNTPIRTATAWRPREVSFVAIAADVAAKTRGADRTVINRSIRQLCERAGAAEFADALIDRGVTVDAARNELLDHLVSRTSITMRTQHNNTTLDNPEVFVRSAGEALHHRINPTAQLSGPARQFAEMSIRDLARECLHRAGGSVMGASAPTLITRALHTTSDFSALLGDAVGRSLRDGYTAAPSAIRTLARQRTVQDFRTQHRVMLDSGSLKLERVNEHGEFKSGTMADSEETYKAETFGKIFGITEQALVNDDLGGLTDIPRRLGAAAVQFENQFLVDLLVSNAGLGPVMGDTKKLFHAGHGNVAAAGAAPAEETLTAARLAMRKQTGPGGALIDVTPWAVLVPSELETATEKLLTAIQAVTTDTTNPFSRLKLIVEPRFSDAFRWYVVANPASADGLEYCYLAGQPGPQVDHRVGFEVSGIEFRVKLHFGAGFVDWRSWYSNAGH